jgi:DNA-binding NarL/FixJ family response regulator
MSVVHVALVDDHRMFREGLAMVLATAPRLRVVTHGATVEDVLRSAEASAIDVLLLDVETDGPPARSTIAALRRTRPDLAVVVLTMHRDEVLRRTLLAAGAAAFVTKDTPSEDLVRQVLEVGDDEHERRPTERSPGASLLSDREVEVLRLVADARSNADIAAELHLAVGTVKRHVYNIYRKLGVRSRVAAVASATRLGVLS